MKAALTIEQANAIIDTVIAAGNYELPKPEKDADIIKSAADVLVQAETAKRAGVNVPAVLAVIELASTVVLPDEALDIPPWEDYNESTAPTAALATDEPRTDTDRITINNMNNDSSEDTAAISTDATLLESDQEQESSRNTIGVPGLEIEQIPRDFSKLSDEALRSLHATRHQVLSKVTFELGLETSDYESAQVNYEQEMKLAASFSEGSTVTERKDKAYLTDSAKEWRTKVKDHHHRVIMLRAYKELLENEIRGLSREFTMRSGERLN